MKKEVSLEKKFSSQELGFKKVTTYPRNIMQKRERERQQEEMETWLIPSELL